MEITTIVSLGISIKNGWLLPNKVDGINIFDTFPLAASILLGMPAISDYLKKDAPFYKLKRWAYWIMPILCGVGLIILIAFSTFNIKDYWIALSVISLLVIYLGTMIQKCSKTVGTLLALVGLFIGVVSLYIAMNNKVISIIGTVVVILLIVFYLISRLSKSQTSGAK
jgi:lipoprotein signal peptidase